MGYNIEDSLEVLYNNHLIDIKDVSNAVQYCISSKIGLHKCSVLIDDNNFCDACLQHELMYLNSLGVKTVASCCGHGDFTKASILVISNKSKSIMEKLGYKSAKELNIGKEYTNWIPKSKLIYSINNKRSDN